MTSLETARSLANGPSWRGGGGDEGEVCIFRSLGIAASPFSLLSMGGVCGRSLTAGKILFTGRQTCSLYLVLWLCGCLCPYTTAIPTATISSALKISENSDRQNLQPRPANHRAYTLEIFLRLKIAVVYGALSKERNSHLNCFPFYKGLVKLISLIYT